MVKRQESSSSSVDVYSYSGDNINMNDITVHHFENNSPGVVKIRGVQAACKGLLLLLKFLVFSFSLSKDPECFPQTHPPASKMYNSHTDIWIVSQIETRTYSIKTLAINTICFHLQAGTFAAVTVECVVYPLDTLKTRYQSPNYNQVFKDASTGAIKKQLLFRGLYQGIGSVVLSTVPSGMLRPSSSEAPEPQSSHRLTIYQPLHSSPLTRR